MLDSSKEALAAIAALVDFVSHQEKLPFEIRHAVFRKTRLYLKALGGDFRSAMEVFADTGMDRWDAEMSALDDLTERKPKGELHAVIAALKHLGDDDDYWCPDPDLVSRPPAVVFPDRRIDSSTELPRCYEARYSIEKK